MHNNSVDWLWNQIFFSWIKWARGKIRIYNSFAHTIEFNALPSNRHAFVDVDVVVVVGIHFFVIYLFIFHFMNVMNAAIRSECVLPPPAVEFRSLSSFHVSQNVNCLQLKFSQNWHIMKIVITPIHSSPLTHTHTRTQTANNNNNALIRCYAMWLNMIFWFGHLLWVLYPFVVRQCVVFRSHRKSCKSSNWIYLFSGND